MSVDKMEKKLLSLLSPDAATSVRYLAERLYVSESTARRYINALAARGLVIRTHGGCLPSGLALDSNTPMYVRFSSDQEEKRRIAERAAAMVPPSATVFLDASSTAFHMVPFLARREDLLVITSGLKTALALAEQSIKTVILGGAVASSNLSANSILAIRQIANYNADFLFFSCDGLSDDGELTDNSFEECQLRREMMERSERCVALMDSGKRGQKFKYRLASLAEIDACITVEDGCPILLGEEKQGLS